MPNAISLRLSSQRIEFNWLQIEYKMRNENEKEWKPAKPMPIMESLISNWLNLMFKLIQFCRFVWKIAAGDATCSVCVRSIRKHHRNNYMYVSHWIHRLWIWSFLFLERGKKGWPNVNKLKQNCISNVVFDPCHYDEIE